MSKRAQRNELERLARRNAYLANRESTQSAATATAETCDPEASKTSAPEQEATPAEATPTAAQVAANRANAQFSTGPTTAEGRAQVAQNRITHGLTGKFRTLPTESMREFMDFAAKLFADHQPDTEMECLLVESLAQNYWRMQRAIRCQDQALHDAFLERREPDAKLLSLYLRYQTTHERSYYKAMRELQNIQKQKRKDQIGFESQKRSEEMHEAKTRLIHAKAQTIEVEASCRQIMEAPIPGAHNIPFELMAKACGDAIASLAMQERRASA